VLGFLFADTNAITLCKSFRTSPTLRDIPIIVEGGSLVYETHVQALMDLKVDALVVAPFRMDEMVAKIAELLHV